MTPDRNDHPDDRGREEILVELAVCVETAQHEGGQNMHVETDGNHVGEDECKIRGALERQRGLARRARENGLRVLDVEADHAPHRVRERADGGHREHRVGPHRPRQDRHDDEESTAEDRGKRCTRCID